MAHDFPVPDAVIIGHESELASIDKETIRPGGEWVSLELTFPRELSVQYWIGEDGEHSFELQKDTFISQMGCDPEMLWYMVSEFPHALQNRWLGKLLLDDRPITDAKSIMSAIEQDVYVDFDDTVTGEEKTILTALVQRLSAAV